MCALLLVRCCLLAKADARGLSCARLACSLCGRTCRRLSCTRTFQSFMFHVRLEYGCAMHADVPWTVGVGVGSWVQGVSPAKGRPPRSAVCAPVCACMAFGMRVQVACTDHTALTSDMWSAASSDPPSIGATSQKRTTRLRGLKRRYLACGWIRPIRCSQQKPRCLAVPWGRLCAHVVLAPVFVLETKGGIAPAPPLRFHHPAALDTNCEHMGPCLTQP